MTKKDLKKVEEVVNRILEDMLYEVELPSLHGYNESIFSIAVLEQMEDYLGYSVEFMGIS